MKRKPIKETSLTAFDKDGVDLGCIEYIPHRVGKRIMRRRMYKARRLLRAWHPETVKTEITAVCFA